MRLHHTWNNGMMEDWNADFGRMYRIYEHFRLSCQTRNIPIKHSTFTQNPLFHHSTIPIPPWRDERSELGSVLLRLWPEVFIWFLRQPKIFYRFHRYVHWVIMCSKIERGEKFNHIRFSYHLVDESLVNTVLISLLSRSWPLTHSMASCHWR